MEAPDAAHLEFEWELSPSIVPEEPAQPLDRRGQPRITTGGLAQRGTSVAQQIKLLTHRVQYGVHGSGFLTSPMYGRAARYQRMCPGLFRRLMPGCLDVYLDDAGAVWIVAQPLHNGFFEFSGL